jgi:hypothetical protein
MGRESLIFLEPHGSELADPVIEAFFSAFFSLARPTSGLVG